MVEFNLTKYQPIIDRIGEEASVFSINALAKLSQYFGIESPDLPGKILTMIVLLGLLFISLKVTQKIVKVVLTILIIVLIGSIGFSIFF